MNETTISSPCHCGCGQLVPQPATGRARKYLNDSHKVQHFNRNKALLAASKSPTPPPITPSKSSLIGSNGVDYGKPEKVLPPNIWPYMPIQSHQTKEQMLSHERLIHHRKEPALQPPDPTDHKPFN